MKSNPTLEIEGHTNGCYDGVEKTQRLSENRALMVKKYLINHNINKNRMTTISYNCKRMLYPENERRKTAKIK